MRPVKNSVLIAAMAFVMSCAVWQTRAGKAEGTVGKTSLMPGGKAAPTQTVANVLEFLPDVVAKFDGGKVTKGELVDVVKPQLQAMVARNQLPAESRLRKMAGGLARYLVDRKLVFEACKEQGIDVKSGAAASKLKEIEQNFGKERFEAGLKQQGMTRADVKEQIRQELLIEKWVEKNIKPGVNVTEAEVRQYYENNTKEFREGEKVKASHILFELPPDASDEKRKKVRSTAEDVLEKLEEGADFAAMAKKHSVCPSKEKGGDLGTFGHGQMVPPFDKAAFDLEKGELSDIVETRFGLHIIKSGGTIPADTSSFADVKDQIRERLEQQKIKSKWEARMADMRKKNDVKIMVPEA